MMLKTRINFHFSELLTLYLPQPLEKKVIINKTKKHWYYLLLFVCRVRFGFGLWIVNGREEKGSSSDHTLPRFAQHIFSVTPSLYKVYWSLVN